MMFLASLVASALAATPTVTSFQFIIEPASVAGCVQLTYATAAQNFPAGVANIRFFYANGASSSVTESSSSFLSTVKYDSHGNMSLAPIKFCGLTKGHTSFKYGLIDKSGTLLEFMAESEFNPDTNGVDIP